MAMKKAFIYSAIALTTMATVTSCGDDFLNLNPIGSVSDNTLSNEDGVEKLLAAAYASLQCQDYGQWAQWSMGTKSLTNWAFGDVIAGDANKASELNDQPDCLSLMQWNFADASNSYLTDKWTAVYEGVKRANVVLSVCGKLEGTDTSFAQAQARFIKGVHMFEAIKVFGAAVPYVTVEDYEKASDPQSSNVDENGNLVYVWDQVAEDFKFAAANLPDSYDYENRGRITSSAAKAMLAKLYIFQSSPYSGVEKNGAGANKWSEAASLLDQVISSGKTADGKPLDLTPDFAKIYTPEGDWTSENVFDIQQQIEGTAWYPAVIVSSYSIMSPGLGGWGFYQPTYDFVNNFIVDENGLPASDYRSHEVLTKMVDAKPVTDLDTYVDPRLDMTVGRFDVPFLDYGVLDNPAWIRDAVSSGLYLTKKYYPLKNENTIPGVNGASDKNQHFMRFSEVLLMRAECAIEANDLPKAQELINKIRERAANTAWWIRNAENPHVGESKVTGATINDAAGNYRIGKYTTAFASKEEATTALRREYRLELGLEGKAWFNLTRWGIAKQVLNEFAPYESKNVSVKYEAKYSENWICLPIPTTEVMKSEGRIVQNAVWK